MKLKKFQFNFPKRWLLSMAIVMGAIIGLGIYVFIESNAISYLSDDSETCINCHIMNPEFASWQHSSHREHAVCNDCHVPQDNFIRKYYFKANDGLRHATMFTLRLEPQVIQIKHAGQKVVKENCIRCHSNLLTDHSMQAVVGSDYYQKRTEKTCWDCHKYIPHGKIKSLSSTPTALVDSKVNRLPDWLERSINNKNNSKNKQ